MNVDVTEKPSPSLGRTVFLSVCNEVTSILLLTFVPLSCAATLSVAANITGLAILEIALGVANFSSSSFLFEIFLTKVLNNVFSLALLKSTSCKSIS